MEDERKDKSQSLDELAQLRKKISELEKSVDIIDSAEDAIIGKTLEGIITSWNKGAEKLYGYTAEEVVGKPVSILAPKGREEEISVLLDKIARGERVEHFETVRKKKDGALVDVSLTISPIKDKKGNIYGVSTIARDITEKKQSQMAIRMALDYAESIVDTVREPLVVMDGDLRVITANRSFYRVFKVTREETEGRLFYELGNRQWDVPELRRLLDGILPAKSSFEDFLLEADFPNMGQRAMLLNARRVVQKPGKPGMILLAIEDITERKREQEGLARIRNLLRAIGDVSQVIIKENERDAMLKGVCDALTAASYSAAMVVVTDDSGKLVTAVESGMGEGFDALRERLAMGEYTKCCQKALAETGPVLVDHMPEPCADCPFTPDFRERKGISIRLEYEGKIFGLLMVRLPEHVFGTEEEMALALEAAQDIAFGLRTIELEEERIRAEETLRKTEEQLQHAQRLEAVGRLAGGVAHDFNNILAVILSYAEFIIEELDENDPMRADALEIKNSANRAAALTRQLLAFSRREVIKPEILNLNNVIDNLSKMLQRMIGEDIELETKLAPDLAMVKADPGQMEQVIANLAVNARDAMPEGGKLTIETQNVYLDEEYIREHATVKPGHYVMLAVSDTGCGMDPETQSKIFEPFFTTKGEGKGTGLGLSTVYGIVKQNKGNIWVYSEPGEGTTFKIYLPRAEGSGKAAGRKRIPVELPEGSETILLVEDDKAVRNLARRILSKHGYKVIDASGGGEALLACERHDGPIHLLLTDVIMPQMSGRELAERLAKVRPEMKVLYMSGYTDNAILSHGVLDEGITFVQKPFTAQELLKKVREALESE